MKKNFLSIVAAAMIALPVIAQAAPVKIGFINSITGKEAQIGENLTNGAAMAIEDLKAKGIQVELIKEDDGGDPKPARRLHGDRDAVELLQQGVQFMDFKTAPDGEQSIVPHPCRRCGYS